MTCITVFDLFQRLHGITVTFRVLKISAGKFISVNSFAKR